MRRPLPVVLLLLIVSCAPKQPPISTAPAAAAAPAPEAIRWVRDSAEYHATLYQVYRLAITRVEQSVAKRTAGSWAVILDADETVLNNSLYQLERARLGLGFTPESWNTWVTRREATPLPGAAAFLARVRALGGRIAIVTNRTATECDDTRANFEAQGLPYDAILCREAGQPSDKNPRFEAVRTGTAFGSGPVDVVAFLGDNIRDFPGGTQEMRKKGDEAFAEFGLRYFIFPNPLYGSFESNPD
jgi:5'-nucleotidase (lipoprotein e(P4) family)